MFSSRTKWSHRDTFQGYAPSWMRVSTVLNRRHITCVLWQRFFCVWWHIFIPFYSISLCFLNPCKCLEHAISLTTQHRKHLPLFWTWHTLALFAASEIWWDTKHPEPVHLFHLCLLFPPLNPLIPRMVSPAFFNHLLVQNCFHTFFSLLLCIVLTAVLFIHCQDGGGQNHTITGFCSSACFVFYSPHNHPQYSVSWTTTEHRGNVCMELCVIIRRFLFLNGNRMFKNSPPLT